MKLKAIDGELSVCKLSSVDGVELSDPFTFLSVTDEEVSLVCRTESVQKVTCREDGWRMFRIEEQLDFSLIGILADISRILADEGIGIFVVSTFNTDYILCKKENFERAVAALAAEGYRY